MDDKKDNIDEKNTDIQAGTEDATTSAKPDRKLSRIDRIRRKIKSMQGKNPDIYPMW